MPLAFDLECDDAERNDLSDYECASASILLTDANDREFELILRGHRGERPSVLCFALSRDSFRIRSNSPPLFSHSNQKDAGLVTLCLERSRWIRADCATISHVDARSQLAALNRKLQLAAALNSTPLPAPPPPRAAGGRDPLKPGEGSSSRSVTRARDRMISSFCLKML